MDPVSVALIAKALDGLSLRQIYTAQNIANANSHDYTPVRVEFEQALKAAAAKGADAVASVDPIVSPQVRADGSSELRVDLELATASQTAMRYSALIEVLARQMALARAAYTGRR